MKDKKDKLDIGLKNYKDKNGDFKSLKDISANYFSDVSDLNLDDFKNTLKEKMNDLLAGFLKYDLATTENLKLAMEGINQALIGKKERELYELLNAKDEITKKIKSNQDDIRQKLRFSFESAEDIVSNSELKHKDELLNLLNNAIIQETRMLEILKESSQNAFLTTLENGVNVQDTIYQISKSMTYSAIHEGEFDKNRILEISKTIILAAVEVANESHIFAKQLVGGAIFGTKEGIISSIERIKEQSKYIPDELKLSQNINQLKDIYKNFIDMLRELETSCESPSKDEIKVIIDERLDNAKSKLKRLSEQASEQISDRLNELRLNENISELVNVANEKLEKLKSAINKNGADFNINDRFDHIKKEFDKKTGEKFEEIKSLDLKQEAKKLGDRAYNAAKNFIGNFKKDKE
ncbi:hypothetical protein [Campylobacter pinnipediorum]|uniref:hypothetical protein n=1 Tax=Campylobacter pinnipediorum TaxID=1965231 RepID=UPI00084D583E|nr:hypothetical protein [Campylobacter pinnipediorum]